MGFPRQRCAISTLDQPAMGRLFKPCRHKLDRRGCLSSQCQHSRSELNRVHLLERDYFSLIGMYDCARCFKRPPEQPLRATPVSMPQSNPYHPQFNCEFRISDCGISKIKPYELRECYHTLIEKCARKKSINEPFYL